MSHSAKEQIASTFLRLLAEKPLDKLTVTSIVEAGGITRQSFYYHFQDIPDLILHIVKSYTDQLFTDVGSAPNTREAIHRLYAPIRDYPELVCRLMESTKYQAQQIIYDEVYGHFVRLFRLQRLEIGMGHRGMEMAATYYAHATIGIIKTYAQVAQVKNIDQDRFTEQIYRLVRGDMFPE